MGWRQRRISRVTVTGLAFLVVFATGVVLALVRHPIYGLYTYLAVFYLDPPSRWWAASLPDLRWSFLAGAVTVAAIWLRQPPARGRQFWLATPPAKIMVFYVIWFWLISLWALAPSLHYDAAIKITKYLVIFYTVYRLVDTPERMTTFLLAHIGGCLYLGVLAFQVGAPGGRLDGVGGPGINDSNTLGMHLATGVVIAAMLSMQLRGWRLIFLVVAIAFALNAIVLTGTRGGFLALVCGGIALAYLRPKRYRAIFYVYAALGLMSIGLLMSNQFLSRLATTEVLAVGDTKDLDTSAYSRIAIAQAQVRMAEEYPFGTGEKGTVVLSPKFIAEEYMSSQGGRSSHNAFLTVLVEEGVPGAILSLALVWWTARTLRRLARGSNAPDKLTRAVQTAAIGGALTVVFVGGWFADFSQCEVQIWMLAALASVTQYSRLSLRRPEATLPITEVGILGERVPHRSASTN